MVCLFFLGNLFLLVFVAIKPGKLLFRYNRREGKGADEVTWLLKNEDPCLDPQHPPEASKSDRTVCV